MTSEAPRTCLRFPVSTLGSVVRASCTMVAMSMLSSVRLLLMLDRLNVSPNLQLVPPIN